MRIIKQLKDENVLEYKSTGFGKLHYTMSAWENEEDMRVFVKRDAHQAAMKKSASIAREIKLYTFDADKMPNWRSAKAMLKEKGRTLKF